METSKERVYAFIDSQNLYLGVKEQGWELDYGRFRKYLLHKYNVTKAFLFIGYLRRYTSLYKKLEAAGYTLVFKEVLYLGKNTKGNVDAELVLHAMIEYENFDSAIIVSGDGDFKCLIEYLERNNKFKGLIVPNRRRYSALLRRFNQKRMFLEEIMEKIKK